MPNAVIDLQVAVRLGLRELGRRLRGEREPAPDLPRFRNALDRALAAIPAGLVAAHAWIQLPASEPPWRDSGIALRAGEEVSYFAAGRVTVSAALDIWVTPKTQLWARIGDQGPIRSSSRDSNTLRARGPASCESARDPGPVRARRAAGDAPRANPDARRLGGR